MIDNELEMYYGDDVKITDKITVTQPTVMQIKNFGEKDYFNAVYNLTSVCADLKWQLWDMGIDYTKIDDYDLFIKVISQLVSSKKKLLNNIKDTEQVKNVDIESLSKNPLKLILKDIDLADFGLYKDTRNNQVILYNTENDITINRYIYARITEVVRKIHGLKRNNETPANERTKKDLIEDARDEAMGKQYEDFKSVLLPYISTISMYSGISRKEVGEMKIYELLYNIKRINKIQDATMLLQGVYSGFANLKGIDKSRLDFTGYI